MRSGLCELPLHTDSYEVTMIVSKKKTDDQLIELLSATVDGQAMLNAINRVWETRSSKDPAWRRRQLEQAVNAL